MFGIGPAYLFVLQHRLPVGLMRGGWAPWLSTMSTNLAIAAIVAVLIWLIGVKAFVLVHLPIMLLAASIGVWLFYVQHQFEQTTWEDGAHWDRHEAALHGSSHYELPAILRWFTANIGVHHIHHLSSNIPYYRLRDGAARSSRAARRRPADAVAELPLRAAGAVGRGAAPAGVVPGLARGGVRRRDKRARGTAYVSHATVDRAL